MITAALVVTVVAGYIAYRRCTSWDSALNERRGIAAAAATRVPVVFSCPSAWAQRRLVRRLKCKRVACTPLVGGTVSASVSRRTLKRWKARRWAGLLRVATPTRIFDASRPVHLPPWTKEGHDSGAISLEDAAKRVRAGVASGADGKGAVLFVLDTGIAQHVPNVVSRVSCVDEPAEGDPRGHGTAVALCAAAVAPRIKLVSVKVLNAQGGGSVTTVLKGLSQVAKSHSAGKVSVVNLSMGSSACDCGTCPVCRAIDALSQMGIAVVASAGNEGKGGLNCPGSSPTSLNVGAVCSSDRRQNWSSRGGRSSGLEIPHLSCYGIVKMPDGGTVHGTSFAAPLVAGGIAAMARAMHSADEVKALYARAANAAIPIRGGRIFSLGRAMPAAAQRRPDRRKFRVASWRVPVRRPLTAAAAMLVLVATTWWFGLDHLGWRAERGDIISIGRVSEKGRHLQFDDGTAVVDLYWRGPRGTRPEPGVIVLWGKQGQVSLKGTGRVAVPWL